VCNLVVYGGASMANNLVIVESPAKAKTLKKFLGSSYKIEASVGHVRDLPKSDMGVDFENDYEPKYITIRGKGEVLAKLRKEVKKAKKVYLATDPDREGEAISWHLITALKLEDKETYRITFNEITKNAVKNAIKEAREIDTNLVDAQQARRVLDRIVGYKIGPFLWRKVKKGLSAGRVQSVALKMICDREEEIENFVREEYWSINADLKSGKSTFNAKVSLKGDVKTKEEAEKIVKSLNKAKFIVEEVKTGEKARKPQAPFTTSTLQQEASKVLSFATNKTMQLAQQLYEGVSVKGEGTIGLVSYIRTDSVRISDEAFVDVKEYIVDNFGKEFSVDKKNEYKGRARSQDAHEAIRPTFTKYSPEVVKDSLSRDQYRLYKLIWERYVASQMPDAKFETLSVKIKAGTNTLRASGSILKFAGFMSVYNQADEEKQEQSNVKIPPLKEGEELGLKSVNPIQHFTQPPARFSDASLVKTLEELGIGRPSTYSSIITTLTARNYITKENKVFYPTELGSIVNEIVSENFDNIVDVDFTAKMEQGLDKVEDGEVYWKELLRDFYPGFNEKILEAEEKVGEVSIEDEKTDVICDLCGTNMVIKFGKFGKFLACPNFPDCRNTKPFFEDAGTSCPVCEGKVLIKKSKKGRKYFGCEHSPECEFISWNKPAGKPCPKCGSFLIIKGSKNKKIACSSAECTHMEEYTEDDE